MSGYENLVRVGIESPFAAPTPEGIEENIRYAKAAVNDSLHRGEAPYASHLFFTQPGLLDDTDPDERMLGIMAGKRWEEAADYTAVYVDRGLSKGMRLGIDICKKLGRPIYFRTLGEKFLTYAGREVIRELQEQGEIIHA